MRKKSVLLMLGLLCASVCATAQPRGQKPEHVRFNPGYHFYPSGDPTGLFYQDGKYYNAWGRYEGSDLVHWQLSPSGQINAELRAKLADATLSQAERDELMQQMRKSGLGGSGSIVVDEKNVSGLGKNVWLAYYHNEVEPYRTQVIRMSYSTDQGQTWTRYEQKNPVLDINSREFRDPKIFWHEPSQKWILVIGWAEAPKVKFFSSTNLIDWTFMSDFGPWGATNGVWECVDFFPLPVDGNTQNMKWVLAHSVQPYTGQYFIGTFDGTRFVLDKDFAQQLTYDDTPQGDVLFDFEHGIDEWQMEGDAFIETPTDVSLYRQGAIMGRVGRYYADSFHNEGRSKGKITSPSFTISRNFINFKVGGAYKPNQCCINLVVDGKVVRTETGRNASSMQWSGWDVQEFRGKTAQIQLVAASDDNWFYVDHIMLCDELRTMQPMKAFWFDYGQDFFAVRSWNTYAPAEKRTIWTAWMGSWRYNGMEPVNGIQSIPRQVKLKTFPEGIRLVQEPIQELQTLRGGQTILEGNTFEGVWTPKKLKPANNRYEMVVEFQNVNAEEVGVRVCVGGQEKTTIGYNLAAEDLYFDRRYSGQQHIVDFHKAVFHAPMKNRYETVKLHLFVDNCSVEVFGNQGETCISNKIYPSEGSTGIEFFSHGGKATIKSIEFYPITGSVMN